ncbi:hypothetical protein TKK_0011988 [Trichogramma kaykai]|uniref:Riboflavin transporter n=1 Tax=Trichogramma kaykai TaxID=54128 RepID=A0ABD2WPC6_9HYME
MITGKSEDANYGKADAKHENRRSDGVESSTTSDCEEERLMLHENDAMAQTVTMNSTVPNRSWPSILVHLLILLFGNAAWIGINGIFIQLPTILKTAPEGMKLSAYLAGMVQAANVVPILYSLFRRSFVQLKESLCIYTMLAVGSLVMGLTAFLYNKTSSIGQENYSIALLVLTFFVASIGCTSSVLFMPYLRNFKEVYLMSYFIGEGLSGLLPSIVALVQGINENSSNCNNSSIDSEQETSSQRFSTQAYFLFIFSCMLLSVIAFFLLEHLDSIKIEKLPTNASCRDTENVPSEESTSVLAKSSTSEGNSEHKHVCVNVLQETSNVEISNNECEQTFGQLSVKDIFLYVLLGGICMLGHGLLLGIQPYSCSPYGDIVYHLTMIFSQISNPTACLLTMWFTVRSRKIINFLAIVILALSCYVSYLAFSSPHPPLQQSLIGKILVIISWIFLMGIISFLKLTITSVFRKKSEKSLFRVGVVMQTGSACGAVLSLIIINANILQEFNPCSSN